MRSGRRRGHRRRRQDAFAYQKIWSGARAILADDFLEYEVFIDPNGPAADGTFAVGGTGVKNAGAIWSTPPPAAITAGAVNTDTVSGNERAHRRRHGRARRVDRSEARAGLARRASMDGLDFGGDNDGNGTYKVLLRNCRITNGAGTDRLAIYPHDARRQACRASRRPT
jgi:hypothetical protein